MLNFLRQHFHFNSTPETTVSFESTTDGLLCRDSENGVKQIRWDDLVRVTIITTDQGPFQEDVFFWFETADGGIVVPHEEELRLKLVQLVEDKFGGMNFEEMINAMACTDNARFVIWKANKASSVGSLDII